MLWTRLNLDCSAVCLRWLLACYLINDLRVFGRLNAHISATVAICWMLLHLIHDLLILISLLHMVTHRVVLLFSFFRQMLLRLRRCLELGTTWSVSLTPWGACRIVPTRKDWSTGLLLLESRLIEALCRHVKVLHFELLDSIAEHAIHLSHVNELVVDFIDATSSLP